MEISKIPDAVWKNLLVEKVDRDYEFLAFKILLARLRLAVSRDPSPATCQKCVAELKTLFAKFGHLQVARNDLDKILKGGEYHEPSNVSSQ